MVIGGWITMIYMMLMTAMRVGFHGSTGLRRGVL